MKFLISIALLLLLTGCGSMGFEFGVSYNDYGVSFKVNGKTPEHKDVVNNQQGE